MIAVKYDIRALLSVYWCKCGCKVYLRAGRLHGKWCKFHAKPEHGHVRINICERILAKLQKTPIESN